MAYYGFPSTYDNSNSNFPIQGFNNINEFMNCCDYRLRLEGKGTVKVRPDRATVDMGVVTENKQLKIAQEENAAIMSRVISGLRDMGIPSEDIQTKSYNIMPQYDFIEGKQVFRGYRVEHMLQVIIRAMARIGEVIDTSVRNGVNQVGNIEFSVSNPSLYYRQALNSAVDDALAKAMTLANKLNIAISKVPVRIVELGYGQESPIVPLTYQAAAPSTPVQTGMVEITALIEAVYTYRQAQ